MGTNTPRNYSSDVRLVDPAHNVDRKVHIWMNNPLRYAGETFYQSKFDVDQGSRLEMTGLQVVKNAGWMLPYVACMIVATGMLAHFSIVLVRFLRRRTEANLAAGEPTPRRGRRAALASTKRAASRLDWLVPLAIVGAAGLFIFSVVRPHRAADGEMNLDAFGRLPVMYEGRMKPFDTLVATACA